MKDEHLYIVTYDISDPKRWRAVFKAMKGYGEWLQLSVFQCRMNARRSGPQPPRYRSSHREDHVLLMDLMVRPNRRSAGDQPRKGLPAVERESIIV